MTKYICEFFDGNQKVIVGTTLDKMFGSDPFIDPDALNNYELDEFELSVGAYNVFGRKLGLLTFVGTPEKYLRHLAEARHHEKAFDAALKRLGGDQEMVAVYIYDDPDSGCKTSKGYKSLKITLMDLDLSTKELNEINSLNDVSEILDEGYEQLVFFGTKEEYKKREIEQERKRLEGLASEVARKHNVEVNSIEFIEAVHKELKSAEYAREEWNNPEIRMEEWAACRHNGLGTDVYFDDLNFENSRINSREHDLDGILSWLSSNCPLLWAKWEEIRISRQAEEENDYEDAWADDMKGKPC